MSARLTARSMANTVPACGKCRLKFLFAPSNAGLWMALHYVPIGLLAAAFSLQELPQLEIPPWPRRARAERWTEDADAGTSGAG